MNDATMEVLTAANSQLLLIDHQPLPAFAVESIDRQALKSNAAALADAASVFGIPTTLTCRQSAEAAGHVLPELREILPDHPVVERTAINAWDKPALRHRLAEQGRRKLVVAGLWTDTAAVSFGLAARREANYEIYVVADASGATSRVAQDTALDRLRQAGAVPVSWRQVLLEWQQAPGRRDTAPVAGELLNRYGGIGIPARTTGGERRQRPSGRAWSSIPASG